MDEERIKEALKGLEPLLGGARVTLEGISDGVVTVRYHRPLQNPSACHVDRTKGREEMTLEAVEDALRDLVPNFKGMRLLQEE